MTVIVMSLHLIGTESMMREPEMLTFDQLWGIKYITPNNFVVYLHLDKEQEQGQFRFLIVIDSDYL